LKTPVRTPQANAFCERLIGTIRRECLDWLIPIHEGHLRSILREWVTHYNRGRPHASLGPEIPDPLSEWKQPASTGHRLTEHGRVIATPILGGLHHPGAGGVTVLKWSYRNIADDRISVSWARVDAHPRLRSRKWGGRAAGRCCRGVENAHGITVRGRDSNCFRTTPNRETVGEASF